MTEILKAKDSQFRLAEDGTISFQVQESNPLPGDVVAVFQKGDSPLAPNIHVKDAKGADEKDLIARLEQWRDAHIADVLELLVGLKKPLPEPKPEPQQEEHGKKGVADSSDSSEAISKNEDEQFSMNFAASDEKSLKAVAVSTTDAVAPPKPLVITETVSSILNAVYDSMGIIPRENLEDLIAKLDADDRRVLRTKRVRLGPILVFIPALNKPAGVRLRALLWSLYNDQPLPADVPNDGIVSQVVDADAVNKDFYQAIGYPVFGNRAIRIDMLDRVICAVYDSAEKGKFHAQHQMAEWLGSPIDDLYGILTAMGHRKIETPEDEVSETAFETKVADGTSESSAEKPQLAAFYLKRGKAFEKAGGNKRPFKKGGFKGQDKKDQDKSKFKSDKKKGKRNKSANRAPKVMSAPAKTVEDSPFAILEQLKSGGKD